MVMYVETLDDLHTAVKAVTSRIRDIMSREASQPEASPLAKAVVKYHEAGELGDNLKALLVELVKRLDGVEPNFRRRRADRPVWHGAATCAIVPLRNRNSHNYSTGAVAIYTGTNSVFVRADGTTGNQMDSCPDAWRLATEEEIDLLFAALRSNPDAAARMLEVFKTSNSAR